ncbi:hypothetical protein WS67_20430 [Burkholderia singularis]|uniref:HTH-like domain-containing protein n=1 Tax=Burkholderia singularis TaxID=1503053 RepID=A0A103DXE1_9BURK|nr:hypothetical protein WS67_20430 [Burkholderia singularis]
MRSGRQWGRGGFDWHNELQTPIGRQTKQTIGAGLRSRVHELFVESRSSAGSRSIMGMMREQGTTIGRFKVSRLMEELGFRIQHRQHFGDRANAAILIFLRRDVDIGNDMDQYGKGPPSTPRELDPMKSTF